MKMDIRVALLQSLENPMEIVLADFFLKQQRRDWMGWCAFVFHCQPRMILSPFRLFVLVPLQEAEGLGCLFIYCTAKYTLKLFHFVFKLIIYLVVGLVVLKSIR